MLIAWHFSQQTETKSDKLTVILNQCAYLGIVVVAMGLIFTCWVVSARFPYVPSVDLLLWKWIFTSALMGMILICLRCVISPWKYFFHAMVFCSMAWLLTLSPIYSFYQKTSKPLDVKLERVLKPSDQVAVYQHYIQDVPFYLKRTVDVVDSVNEMEFGVDKLNPSWFYAKKVFWKKWGQRSRMFAVMRLNDYQSLQPQEKGRMYVWMKNDFFILLSNHSNLALW